MRSDARSTQLAIRIAFLFCFICSLAPLASAQTGQLAGVVRDSSGAVVPGASLALQNVATGLLRKATSDQTGSYVLAAIPPGRYVLRAKKDGFAVFEVLMQVEVDLASRYDVVLMPAGVKEEVSVSTAPILTSRDGSVSTVIDRRFAENIPLNGRSFHTLIELAPGVVATPGGSFTTNGQRPGSAYFTVDGLSGNSGVPPNAFQGTNATPGQLPATNIVGGLNALVTVDALQEFRVQTSSFAAEYGRTPGAQVSIVTRSGTNSYHGSLFDQIRHDALDATNWFINNTRGTAPTPKLRQNNFGGTFGGPLVLDKLFFFGSYEGLRLSQPKFQQQSVPETWIRLAAPPPLRELLELLPVPTGAEDGDLTASYILSVSEPTISDIYGMRVDLSPSAKTSLMGRVSVTPSGRRSTNVGTRSESESRIGAGAFNATHILGSRLVGDVRVGYSRSRYKSVSSALRQSEFEHLAARDWLPPTASLADTRVSVVLGNQVVAAGPTTLNKQEQLNIVANATSQWGRHLVKAGVDYRSLTQSTIGQPLTIAAEFPSVENLVSGRATALRVTYRTPVRGFFKNSSFYAQDTWQVSGPLTVTFGLRWDFNPSPAFPAGEAPLAATTVTPIERLAYQPRGTDLWRTDGGRIAPRIGASWAVDRRARMTLSGGFGVFYDPAAEASSQVFSSSLFPHTVQLPVYQLDSVPMSDTLRAVIGQRPTANLTPPFQAGLVVDPDLALPRTEHWNLKVERQLGTTNGLSFAYVGSRGENLLSRVSYAAPNASFLSEVTVYGSLGRSRYDSMQLEYRRRSAGGVHALASYTFAKSSDNVSSGAVRASEELVNGENGGLFSSDFDVRHVLTAAVSWTMPSPTSGVARSILGSWSIDVLGRFRSGFPLTVVTGRNVADVTTIVELPDIVANEPTFIYDSTLPWRRRLNPAAFQRPTGGVQGNLPRNSLRGPAARQVDLGLRKAISIGRGVRAQIRLDAFNVFNLPNFANPVSAMNAGAMFGRVTNTLDNSLSGAGGLSPLYQTGGARSLEIGLRLNF